MSRPKDRLPRNRSYFPYAVVIALSAILVLLAWLQYRWSNQVSQAERDRMEASLRIATTQFRQDFSRDLQSLGSGLQPDSEMLANRDWDSYATQSADFLKGSAYPELAAALYLWQPEKGLWELDRQNHKFEPAAEPPSLQSVLSRIRNQSETGRSNRGFRNMLWLMDGSAPALVHGLNVYGDPEDRRPPQPPTLVGYVIVLLNREFIQNKFLPELAARHFGGPDGFLYQVGVFMGEGASHPIYQSGPGIDKTTIKSADATLELIDPRPRQPGPGQGAGGPPRNQRPVRALEERFRMGRRPGMNAPVQPIVAEARTAWTLVVRHRAGSVDAAVAGLRYKNLAISFAILLLLAASMGLIVVTTQRAQRLARLQVEFVAGVSHELRTPLAVITSAADNLTAGIVEDKDQVKLYGSLIRNEARRLQTMMEQILAFASGQNKRNYEPHLIGVEDLIDRSISLSASVIQEAQFVVEKHVPPGLAPVFAEENGLLQCLQNLIQNAIKYGGANRWIGIDAHMDGGSVLISVADRGMGIEADDLPHVFDAFYRGKAATDAQIHGTGLGLSLATSFVRAAGGTITVKSTVGEGSCFMVRLPAAKPELAAGAEALTGQTA